MLHLEQRHRQELLDLVRLHLPADASVLIFGSRVHGRHLKPHSDLDVCVRRGTPLPDRALAAFKEACEQSNLPFKVDVVDWAELSEEFQRAIADDLTLLTA